jgi:sulfotransferase family protein
MASPVERIRLFLGSQVKSSPILVTGMPRSGTTWVGSILATSDRLVRINEPLNPEHPPGLRPGILDAAVSHRFHYVSSKDDSAFRPAFEDLAALKFHAMAELRMNHRPYDVLRCAYDSARFTRGRMTRRAALIVDPFAVFSVEWFKRTLHSRIVVVVRRPEAVVSSRLRLGWSFDPRDLLAQPALREDIIDPIEKEHPEIWSDRGDMIARGSVLWNVVHLHIASRLRAGVDMLVVRHEDLSTDPRSTFGALFGQLDLGFDRAAERAVKRSTRASNPARTSVKRPHVTQLDSLQNLSAWKERLSEADIRRIRKICRAGAATFYPEFNW